MLLPAGTEAIGQELDEAVLREHRVATQGPGLLDFFRQRTPKPDHRKIFRAIFVRLSSASYAERARASDELEQMGPVIRPLLQRELERADLDVETRRRGQRCLSLMPGEREAWLAQAAARQIGRTRPAGAIDVLLAYVPFVPCEATRQETQEALNAICADDETAERKLRDALGAADGRRRAAAAEALARTGPDSRPLVLPLLADAHPQVRFQIAVALTEEGQRAGVPALIDLLPDLPAEQRETALDLLVRLAGEAAPAGEGRAEWQRWYQAEGANLDLAARLHAKELGYTVITQAGTGLNGQVLELDSDGKVRWQFGGTRYPVDVQVLGPDRVLLAEYLGRRVTERDFQGKVLWEKAINTPVACQRLPGGQTFIASRQQLLVVERDGKETFTWFKQNTSIVTARRLRDGRTVVATSAGKCLVLDPLGREVRSFTIGQLYSLGSNLDVLPNGRVLAPQYSANRVVELDLAGRPHWEAKAAAPTSATRLANGNTLVVSLREQRVVELAPDGREVWSHRTEGRPWRARRR